MNDNITIHKMCDISTEMLDQRTLNELEHETFGPADCNYFNNIVVYKKGPYGYFIYFTPEWREDEERHNIPQKLREVIEIAETNGCDVICIDRDA